MLIFQLSAPDALATDSTKKEPLTESSSAHDAAECATNDDAIEEECEETRGGFLDTKKAFVDSSVRRASQWVDSFFTDPNYDAEAANSQIRLRPELYFSSEDDDEINFRFRARLDLNWVIG